MNILLKRFSYNDNGTNGILLLDGKFECYTAENTKEIIPCGTYEIGYNPNLSDKTMEYKQKYMWFNLHLQLNDVFKREWVYIHIGNDPVKDSEGCILVGESFVKNDKGWIGNSMITFRCLYKKICDSLDENEEVFITIEDTWND
jgi:hypothetical protein